MLHRVWTLLRDTVEGFVNDGAMSRGAAIAYYTIFSIDSYNITNPRCFHPVGITSGWKSETSFPFT